MPSTTLWLGPVVERAPFQDAIRVCSGAGLPRLMSYVPTAVQELAETQDTP